MCLSLIQFWHSSYFFLNNSFAYLMCIKSTRKLYSKIFYRFCGRNQFCWFTNMKDPISFKFGWRRWWWMIYNCYYYWHTVTSQGILLACRGGIKTFQEKIYTKVSAQQQSKTNLMEWCYWTAAQGYYTI